MIRKGGHSAALLYWACAFYSAGVSPVSKTVYIKTYGCQMNVYDSERMAASMGASDYKQVDTPEDADLVILNTCHIREKAAEKVFSELGRLKPLKSARPELKKAVAGCDDQVDDAEN